MVECKIGGLIMNGNFEYTIEKPVLGPKDRFKKYAEFIVCSILIPVILFIGCIVNLIRLLF